MTLRARISTYHTAALTTPRATYGGSRHSTRSFLAHHMECISHAAVHADAIAVANAAASLSFQLSMGLA